MATLLDFPQVQSLAKGDLLYGVRGTGLDRDKAFVAQGPIWAKDQGFTDFNNLNALEAGQHWIRSGVANTTPANGPAGLDIADWVLLTIKVSPDAAGVGGTNAGLQVAIPRTTPGGSAPLKNIQEAWYVRSISGTNNAPSWSAWRAGTWTAKGNLAAGASLDMDDGWYVVADGNANTPTAAKGILQSLTTQADTSSTPQQWRVQTYTETFSQDTYQRVQLWDTGAQTWTSYPWRLLGTSQAVEMSAGTGVVNWTGSQLTINAGTNAVNVAAGSGWIVDTSAGFRGDVDWPATTLNPAFSGSRVGWVYVNQSGQVQFTTSRPSPYFRRSNIVLAVVTSTNGSTVTGFTFTTAIIESGLQALRDMLNVTGSPKSGFRVVAGSTGMRLTSGAGSLFGLGLNGTDFGNPNVYSYAGQTDVSFYTYTRNGLFGSLTQSVPATQYDNAGTLTALASNNWTIHRLFWAPDQVDPNGVWILQIGQNQYASLAAAQDALPSENFVIANDAQLATLMAVVFVRQGATAINNVTQALIENTGVWSSVGGFGTGGNGATGDFNFNGLISDPNTQEGISGWTLLNTGASNVPAPLSGSTGGLLLRTYSGIFSGNTWTYQHIQSAAGRVFRRARSAGGAWGTWIEDPSQIVSSPALGDEWTGWQWFAGLTSGLPDPTFGAFVQSFVDHNADGTRTQYQTAVSPQVSTAKTLMYRERGFSTVSGWGAWGSWLAIGDGSGGTSPIGSGYFGSLIGTYFQTEVESSYGTARRVFLYRRKEPVAYTVNSIRMASSLSGGGVTVGCYRLSGGNLTLEATATLSFATAGYVTGTLSAPVTIAAGEEWYFAVMATDSQAGSNSGIAGKNATAPQLSANYPTAQRPLCYIGSGTNSMPASISLSATTVPASAFIPFAEFIQ